MNKVMLKSNVEHSDRRYAITEVAIATGTNYIALREFFARRGVDMGSGVTLSDIVEYLNRTFRGRRVKWDDVNEIRQRIREECEFAAELEVPASGEEKEE